MTFPKGTPSEPSETSAPECCGGTGIMLNPTGIESEVLPCPVHYRPPAVTTDDVGRPIVVQCEGRAYGGVITKVEPAAEGGYTATVTRWPESACLIPSRTAAALRPLGHETATANDVWAQERINAPWSIKARKDGAYSLHDDDGAGRATVSCEADAIFLAALVLEDARKRNPDRLPEHLRNA